MDDETLSQLITAYSDQMKKLKSTGLQESGWMDYLLRSANQFVLGNFSHDTTLLGTAAQLGAGLFDLDLPMDIRDLTYDLANWEWSEDHLNQTAIDAVGLLPFIGAMKYFDEGAELAGSMDEIADLTRGAGKLDDVIDSTDELIEGAEKIVKNLKPQNLMDELAQSGVKYTPDDMVMVTKTPDGKLIWLESGNSESGLQHIVDGHAADFTNRGINDIPSFINRALQETPVKTGANEAGPYAEYLINGSKYKVAYGTNGYIVSFYPIK